MKIQTRLNTLEIKSIPTTIEEAIDSKLREDYNNRDTFNPIKRKIIEIKYNKAYGKAIEKMYYSKSTKVD